MYSDCWTYPKEKIDEMVGDVSVDVSELKSDLQAKLDKPSVGGTDGQVLTSDGDGGQGWQTPVVPTVPVTDVQINSTSIVNNGVANVPIATENNLGLVISSPGYTGVSVNAQGRINVIKATAPQAKAGTNYMVCLTPNLNDSIAFYGLAKAAGDSTQSASDNAVGNYTDGAKSKIQSMLGIADIIAPDEPSGTASKAYSTGECFLYNGKLYKATETISQNSAIVPETNCSQTTLVELIGG